MPNSHGSENWGYISGLGSQVIGRQVRVIRYGYGLSGSGTGSGLNLYLVLNTRTWNPTAETRDLRMVLLQLCRDAVPTLPRCTQFPFP
jgi:hypothetical protein